MCVLYVFKAMIDSFLLKYNIIRYNNRDGGKANYITSKNFLILIPEFNISF